MACWYVTRACWPCVNNRVSTLLLYTSLPSQKMSVCSMVTRGCRIKADSRDRQPLGRGQWSMSCSISWERIALLAEEKAMILFAGVINYPSWPKLSREQLVVVVAFCFFRVLFLFYVIWMFAVRRLYVFGVYRRHHVK